MYITNKNIIFIIILQVFLLLGCRNSNKGLIYEQIALDYCVDSLLSDTSIFPKGLVFCYDGLVSGCSHCTSSPLEATDLQTYLELLEFEKAYEDHNAKDFYVRMPKGIKHKSFQTFIEDKSFGRNLHEYYIVVQHHICSKQKVLVSIQIYGSQIYDKLREYYTASIFLDVKGSVIDVEAGTSLFPLDK